MPMLMLIVRPAGRSRIRRMSILRLVSQAGRFIGCRLGFGLVCTSHCDQQPVFCRSAIEHGAALVQLGRKHAQTAAWTRHRMLKVQHLQHRRGALATVSRRGPQRRGDNRVSNANRQLHSSSAGKARMFADCRCRLESHANAIENASRLQLTEFRVRDRSI